MKTLKSSLFALGAIISTLAAHPGDALALGNCKVTFTNVGQRDMDCSTSQSEFAGGYAKRISSTQSEMRVVFSQGQTSAEGLLLRPNGSILCSTGVLTGLGSGATVTCGTPVAHFRIIVN